MLRRYPAFFLAILLVTFFMATFAMAASDEDSLSLSEKSVLYLSSYSPGYETFFRQVDGIESILSVYDIHLDIEFMDTKRLYTEENLTYFDQLFSYKIGQLDAYDAVIVADDNAADYLMDRRESYFPNTPIVFMGVNNLENAKKYSSNPMVTGIVEEISMGDTLELARVLNPEATRIVALSDETTSGLHDLAIYYDQESRFSDLELTHINLSEMTFDEFGQALAGLGPKDIIIRISTYRDITGESISFAEGVDLILSHATQPVYHTYYWGIPDGFIGGKVVTHYEQGVRAGNIVLNILQGQPVQEIPLVETSPNQYMVNYPVLKAYGYDEKSLPKNTLLVGKEVGLFDQYRTYILGALLILILQGIIIFNLNINIKKRKKSEEDLLDSKKKLILANDELSANNEELTAAFANIEERDERICKLINIDSLTGLKNRFSISEVIQSKIDAPGKQDPFAILFLDVDNFKHINDTFGHSTGDKVIQATGKLLEQFISDRLQVGRFGGDEFLIYIQYRDTATDLEPLIDQINQAFSNIITVDQQTFYLTVSIGIALYPDHASTQTDLIKQADLALYEAKARGKNTVVYFNAAMDNELTEKIDFQNAVRDGFANQEFRMNYQPYIDLKSGKVSGFEALIRWKSPSLGHVSPYRLIRAAEEMGMIVELGQWIMREACAFAKQINDGQEDTITLSINVSAVQVMDQSFAESFLKIIDEVGVSPSLICLEVTETILMDSLTTGSNLFSQLKSHGLQISLDDFGTGYSSLNYFRELPFDILKIDKSFVDNITNTDYDAYLSKVMVTLAHMKSLKVIAEGVEVQSQLDILRSFGCDMIQGYYYSRPLEPVDVRDYIGSANSDREGFPGSDYVI